MAEPRVRGLLNGDGSYVENRPTKWQQTLGILNEYNPIDAFWRLYESDMAKGGPITEENIADGMTVTGTVMGGSSFVPKEANALNMGIRAYHGSPHDFDRFDMSKIGTGEGAQAYGHGLYFAENEDVARGYRDKLSRMQNYSTAATIKKYGGIDEAISAIKADMANIQEQRKNLSPEHTNSIALAEKQIQKRADLLGKLLKAQSGQDSAGKMYAVDINADPEQFLDWGKPLNEQAPYVRDAIEKSGLAPENADLGSFAGVPIQSAPRWADTPEAAAKLREAGIPGIKYLDAGSRVPSAMARKELADWQAQLSVAEKELADATARGDKWLISRKQAEVQRVQDGIARVSQEAEGTRNYVVFDDKLINILRKYGIAGLLGSSAAYNAMSDQPPEQY